MLNEKKDEKYTLCEKVDAEELAKEIVKLSPEEANRIYYMIQGAALVSGSKVEPMINR